ncbi:hypothetical protein [Kitasatospora sp. NPDC001175]|uniref:hypothetical protein n=1 Tax=Kitasatospora sp. NPDC001175 TaxID=3157103 RepID=UPI003D007F99
MSVTLCVLTAVLGIATTVNLMLTCAVIRRLREIESRPAGSDDKLPAVGTRVGEFSAETVAGQHIDRSDVAAGDSLVGFFLVGCAPCAKLIDALTSGADLSLLDPLFFVSGDAASAEAQEIAAKLGRVGRVALIGAEPELTDAFGGIGTYPILLRVRDGVISQAGRTLDSVVAVPSAGSVRTEAQA